MDIMEDYENTVKDYKELLDYMFEFADKEYNSRKDVWTRLFSETEDKLLAVI